MKDDTNDPKYPKTEWKKMQYNHKSLDDINTELHYWENIQTGNQQDFKFKDYKKHK